MPMQELVFLDILNLSIIPALKTSIIDILEESPAKTRLAKKRIPNRPLSPGREL